MDGVAWCRLQSMGLQSWTGLSDFTSLSFFQRARRVSFIMLNNAFWKSVKNGGWLPVEPILALES